MKPFVIAGMKVPVGHRKDVKICISEFYTATPVFILVTVIHGAFPGPTLFIVAAVHG
ncbi:MAG: succinylglutamate desuccinylase, partial [Planctomycetota bacterium]